MPVDGRALLAAWCEHRDSDVRRRLIEHHLPLVRALARRFHHSGEPFEDLVQVGAVGLIKAVDRYDRGCGSSLEAYLVPTVLGEIRRHLRDTSQPVHVPRADRDAGVVVRAVPLDEEAAAVAPDGADDRVLVERLLRALPRHERRVVRLRYFADLSQRGIAGELGLSQVHVSRLLQSSLEHLREALGSSEVSR
jgi:RNA polymerase sigma-B factor